MTSRRGHRAPSKCWVSVAMSGLRLQQDLDTRSCTHACTDTNSWVLKGCTAAHYVVRLWPSWPCPVWSALEMVLTFLGSFYPWQVLHPCLPPPTSGLWRAGSVPGSYRTLSLLHRLSSYLHSAVGNAVQHPNPSSLPILLPLLFSLPSTPPLPTTLKVPPCHKVALCFRPRLTLLQPFSNGQSHLLPCSAH